ncbi:MAG: hypothetical protein IJW32_05945 [Clostridia bacterium]|nr:hypothetical protein [Clostridia bacterium]MBQ9793256.1 hypothetical protein [Clostridia bacterium]
MVKKTNKKTAIINTIIIIAVAMIVVGSLLVFTGNFKSGKDTASASADVELQSKYDRLLASYNTLQNTCSELTSANDELALSNSVLTTENDNLQFLNESISEANIQIADDNTRLNVQCANYEYQLNDNKVVITSNIEEFNAEYFTFDVYVQNGESKYYHSADNDAFNNNLLNSESEVYLEINNPNSDCIVISNVKINNLWTNCQGNENAFETTYESTGSYLLTNDCSTLYTITFNFIVLIDSDF